MRGEIFLIGLIVAMVALSGCTEQPPSVAPECGNGVVEAGEQCDNIGCPENQTCNNQCACETVAPDTSPSGESNGTESFEEYLAVCDKIENSDFKNACYAAAKSDPSYCDELNTDRGKDICQSYVREAYSIKTGINYRETYDPDFDIGCEDESLGEIIADRCFYNRMLGTNGPENCSKINDDELRDECFLNLSIRIRDGTLCNSIQGDSEKEECILLNERDPDSADYCLAFESLYEQRKCMVELALKFNDASYCDKSEPPYKINSCYLHLTSKTGQNYCEFVTAKYLNSSCWVLTAIELKDESICESSRVLEIEDDHFAIIKTLKFGDIVVMYDKEMCYTYVALAKNDSALCEKTTYKDNCYYEFVFKSIDLANTEYPLTVQEFAYENLYEYNT